VLSDSFERALETTQPGPRAPSSVKAVYDGILLIHRQLLGLLQRRGVTPIVAVGEPFDPTRHEAVAQIPAGADQQEGTVALEMQKGYLLGDQVLRPSKVAVAVSEPPGEQHSEDA
jgi:molecular chaperone GrpE